MMEAPTPTAVCATCKSRIEGQSPRYRCSVSACNAGRIKLRFCSVACFEAHIPTARHRKASCVVEGAALISPAGAQPTSAG